MESLFEPDLFEILRTQQRLARSKLDQGRRFERLMKYAFARHPGEYGPARFKDVWLWSEWPDRARLGYGGDIGIDLVAEQTEAYGGGLCAIQCKFHSDPADPVPTGAVNSFLAASSGRWFSSRILVATSRLTKPAYTKIAKAEPQCQLLQGSDLHGWPVRWADFVKSPEDLQFEHVRYEPHPYQAEAVDEVTAGFWEHDRGKLILPCGTGKSVVALWVAERVARWGGRVLYLVPSIALMGQTMREWARQRHPDIPHRYVGVCSDARAGRGSEDTDLTELAMPVTTDPERIADKLAEQHKDAMTVVFCTYQSLPRVAEAQAAGVPSFDLAVCDEAHRTTGVHESSADGSAFTLVHDSGRVHADRRLYMTATPRMYGPKIRAKARGHAKSFDFYSMDDADTYGPEFYRMRFADAVEGGHLSDYRVAVIAMDEASIEEPFETLDTGEDKSPVNLRDAVKIAGCWDALADPTTRSTTGRVTGTRSLEHAARRAILFTNTIKNSKRVQRYWNPVTESMAPEPLQNRGGGGGSTQKNRRYAMI